MADIRPFHGVHYNTAVIKDITGVLCPPYDVISPLIQQELYQKNDVNFVRIEYGRELPHDKDTDNKYTRASDTLKKWLEQGTLQVDDKPAIYLHDHYFTYQNREYRRRSITCLVKLEEWDKMVVRPHEGTTSKPRGDRLSMLWMVQANTSPILALYEDSRNTISSLLDTESEHESLLQAKIGYEETHYLWSVRDVDAINENSKAKELLRTTTLKTFEISYQIGYNDPHYFSQVFKKNTDLSPKKFRLQVQAA